jgi:hypothetical protein
MKDREMADYFEHKQKMEAQRQLEAEGKVADSMEVRIALMEQFHRGEKTLAEIQDELQAIKRSAKRNGKITRAQAYMGR